MRIVLEMTNAQVEKTHIATKEQHKTCLLVVVSQDMSIKT